MENLTQADKQAMLHLIKHEITQCEHLAKRMKSYANILYNVCDKADTSQDSYESFRIMNECRDFKRYYKNRVQRLSTIAKNLKKDLT